MSIWLEIHCDVRSEVPDPARDHNDRICWGHQNRYPMSGGTTPQAAYAGARREANARRWVRRKFEWGMGWVCPHCQKFPPP